MGKDRKKRTGLVLIKVKRAMPLLLWAVGIAFVCLVGGLVAKYVVSVPHGDNQIGADHFYFTLDLLTATEELTGQDENRILERTIDLYGGGQNSLTFRVRNYLDDLRINGSDVAYTLSWEHGITVKHNDTAVESGSSYTLTGGGQASDAFTVSFDDATTDGEAVITISSTAPYQKEMKLTLNFHSQQYDVRYRVEDTAGGAYANLIVMVGKAGGVAAGKLRFDWTAAGDALQVDCTNTNILENNVNAGELVVPGSVASGYALNTRAIGESGSISILFFKTDASRDYSKADTVAALDGEIYEILIEPKN